MSDRAFGEYADIGCAATDVDKTNTQLFFIFRQHGHARCELFKDDVIDLESAASYTLDNVLCGTDGAGNDVHFCFEANAAHTDRFANSFLFVDNEFLRQDV